MKYRITPQDNHFIAEIVGAVGSSPLLNMTRTGSTICLFKTAEEAEREVIRRVAKYSLLPKSKKLERID